jgi:hypothetical protein
VEEDDRRPGGIAMLGVAQPAAVGEKKSTILGARIAPRNRL